MPIHNEHEQTKYFIKGRKIGERDFNFLKVENSTAIPVTTVSEATVFYPATINTVMERLIKENKDWQFSKQRLKAEYEDLRT